MREPNWKQIREVLEKLADDQPHSTGDLFPGVKGDDLIEPSERIMRLAELGYLTYRNVSQTGYNQIPRGVAGIKIAPAGHQWLEQHRTLRRYADRLFSKTAEQVNDEHQNRQSAIKVDFNKRGMAQSGGFFGALANAGVERIEALAKARMDTIVDTYEKAGVRLDRSIVDDVSAEITQQCETGKNSLVAELSHHAKRIDFDVGGFQDALQGEIGRRVARIESAIKRDLELKLDEAILQLPRTVPPAPGPGEEKSWDAFISYASEDEKEFVLPLAHRLTDAGVRVWFAPLTLKVGDSLRRSIDEGLARSRYGIVVLSPNFFAKDWPQRELEGLVAKEVGQEKVILPIWHRVSRDFVVRFSPMLADRVAANSAEGLDTVVIKLLDAIRTTPNRNRD